jgi:hypothetical protein
MGNDKYWEGHVLEVGALADRSLATRELDCRLLEERLGCIDHISITIKHISSNEK